MIIVTGGVGMIGSNLVKILNDNGLDDIIVVDDLSDGTKFKNIIDCDILDYWDKDDFLHKIQTNHPSLKSLKVIFHQGACSTTTEWDGRFMMENNYEYSKTLLHFALTKKIPFIYASSAAVYGAGTIFKEQRQFEAPLNVYGYSKFLFDEYVRRLLPKAESQIVGLRYFNVYGPKESHKGSMASVAFHANNQLREQGVVKLFEGTKGYGDGEQRRDFIYVGDVANINLWFYHEKGPSGIYNVGTGHAQTFNELANAVIDWHGKGNIQYIPFPKHLKGCYQSFTEADISKLREAGYQGQFFTVEQGVKHYLDWLMTNTE